METKFLIVSMLWSIQKSKYHTVHVISLCHVHKNILLFMSIIIYQDIGISMYLCFCVKESESEVAQLCLTLCDPLYYSLPGFSVHGVFQARVLEWVAIAFSRGSSQPRDQTRVSCIVGRRFTLWATREAKLKQS